MTASPGPTDPLARLRRERETADHAYNEALTALDHAIRRVRELPHPPAPYDDSQVGAMNERWELLSLKPADQGGWLARVRTHAWAMVAPLFERQQTFNAAVVDHVNRNARAHQDTARAMAEILSVIRDELSSLLDFETRLILYAQQVTPYVDTKDRSVAALPHGLAAAISGLGDEMQKRWESMAARERRYEALVNDVRSTLSVVQRAVQTMKRELERRGPVVAGPADAAVAPPSASGSLDSYKYVGFEDAFRGSQVEIRQRLAAYLPLFTGASDVLDIGCGRGEFLDLLREQGVSAHGVDLNNEMAALCRERGLQAVAGDALQYLEAQPDGSLGGLFAAQVVEHLEPGYLMRLLETAYHKLRPGSKIVLETINPACWYAFFSSYIRDITHVRPLHPDTLQYLVVASGFQRVEIQYSAPFPDESKLQPIPVRPRSAGAGEGEAQGSLEGVTAVFNDNVEKLNDLLFTYLDFAAIGERV
jgi:O-antigen chain-terminating methyltransferase